MAQSNHEQRARRGRHANNYGVMVSVLNRFESLVVFLRSIADCIARHVRGGIESPGRLGRATAWASPKDFRGFSLANIFEGGGGYQNLYDPSGSLPAPLARADFFFWRANFQRSFGRRHQEIACCLNGGLWESGGHRAFIFVPLTLRIWLGHSFRCGGLKCKLRNSKQIRHRVHLGGGQKSGSSRSRTGGLATHISPRNSKTFSFGVAAVGPEKSPRNSGWGG